MADLAVAVWPRRSWIAAQPWPAIHARFPAALAPPTEIDQAAARPVYIYPALSLPSIDRPAGESLVSEAN